MSHASTIQRQAQPAIRADHGPVRRPEVLIQDWDGVELPAPGRWRIVPGQPLTATSRRRGGEVTLETLGGVLEVPEGRGAVGLELGFAISGGPPECRSSYDGKLVTANALGQWHFVGTFTAGEQPPLSLRLAVRYQGVYRHGARPVAWLTVNGSSTPSGRRRFGRTRPALPGPLRGDLNAQLPGVP